jgi:methylthioribose-1-phosphate isomerase
LRRTAADNVSDFWNEFLNAKEFLASARPTAVNLFSALNRQERRLLSIINDLKDDQQPAAFGKYRHIDLLLTALLEEAEKIRFEEEEASLAMGEYGLNLLKPGMSLLTHCNAGSLASVGYGTALSSIYLGHERGYGFKVFADETRPLLQGARLTTWELIKAGVDVTLICDNMASAAMKKGWVQAVLTGCDRMAANGDGANKIGTSALAILAKAYDIPFYMFMPTSTIDMSTESGDLIPIEQRDGDEISKLWFEKPVAPDGVKTWNPAFDITENKYITAIVTEKGVIYPPFYEGLLRQ